MQKFFIGDTVKYVGKSKTWELYPIHIITEATFVQGEFEYATTYGAWFSNNDFVLVEKATKKSLKEIQRLEEEGD